MWTLCMPFRVTASVAFLLIRFGRILMLHSFSDDSNGMVRMTSEQEIERYKNAFESMYHTLEDVYAVADGLEIYLEQSGDCVIQNMFYNGWTHDHYVGNVLVFSTSGVIIDCAFNAPWAMHDSKITEWGAYIVS